MVSIEDRASSRHGRRAIPPHNLEAEESLLGAMMLSAARRSPPRSRRDVEPADFYKPAHGVDLRGRATALHSQGEPVDPVTVAEELRRAGAARRARRPRRRCCASRRDARVGERGALRADRRRARDAAAADRDRGRHPGDGVRRATTTSTRPSTAPSRWSSRSPSGASPTRSCRCYPALEETMDQLEALYDRDGDDHRRRRPATTTSTSMLLGLQPSTLVDRRGPSRSGKDVARARRRAARRAARAASRCCSSRWRWATSSSRSACSRPRRSVDVAQAADRQALRARVAEAQPGGRPARRSAVLHRRQPALHGDGDARQGAAHQGALRRPRADRRRLPPADGVAAARSRTARSRCRRCRAA